VKLKLNRNILKLILALLTAILSVSVVFIVLKAWERRYDSETMAVMKETETSYEGAQADISEEDDGSQVYRNGRWYTLNKDLESVLLIGLDKFEDDRSPGNEVITNNQRADFLMLLLLDHAKKTCRAVHINRDTMAEIHRLGFGGADAGTATEQLALAHVYGTGAEDSCKNTVRAVSDLLYGIPVDHFVSVTMDAVPAVTDLVEGIPLTVMDDLTAEDPAMKEGAEIRLTGEQALRYVRARQDLEDPTNVRRMERQRQFIEAFRKTYAEEMEKDETILTDALVTAAPYILTDCAADDLDRIAECTAEYKDQGIRTIEGEVKTDGKYAEFYPDQEALKNLITELFYVEAGAEPEQTAAQAQ